MSVEEPEKFTTSARVLHEIPTGSQEIDYFSLSVHRDFCDFVAQETIRYADKNQQQKADPKWENTNGREIQPYFDILIYRGGCFKKSAIFCIYISSFRLQDRVSENFIVYSIAEVNVEALRF